MQLWQVPSFLLPKDLPFHCIQFVCLKVCCQEPLQPRKTPAQLLRPKAEFMQKAKPKSIGIICAKEAAAVAKAKARTCARSVKFVSYRSILKYLECVQFRLQISVHLVSLTRRRGALSSYECLYVHIKWNYLSTCM